MKRKLKKLIVCAFASLIAVSAVVAPVSAKEFEDVRDTYTQPYSGAKSYNNSDEKKALKKSCRVENPANFYLDGYLKSEAEGCISSDYKLYDLRSLTNFGIASVLCDKGLAFNYGFMAENDKESFKNSTLYIFKCSPSDFERLKKYVGSEITFVRGDGFITGDPKKANVEYCYERSRHILQVLEHR